MGGGERPLIRQFRDALVGRPVAVRAVSLDADQHRAPAALRALQRRRHVLSRDAGVHGRLRRPRRAEPLVQVHRGDDYHGRAIADPYRWMEDLESRDIRRWIDEQSIVTERHLQTLPLRTHFRDRITALWDYPKVSVDGIVTARFGILH
jgi:Prolyl oligopeptidase, N-terminal beta-propeller domain